MRIIDSLEIDREPEQLIQDFRDYSPNLFKVLIEEIKQDEDLWSIYLSSKEVRKQQGHCCISVQPLLGKRSLLVIEIDDGNYPILESAWEKYKKRLADHRLIVSSGADVLNLETPSRERNGFQIKIKTDMKAFENELHRFARNYKEDGLKSIEISEWRNYRGEAIDEISGDNPLVAIDPIEGRGWAISRLSAITSKERAVIKEKITTLWISRLNNEWIQLKIFSILDTGRPFFQAFIWHIKSIWETTPIGDLPIIPQTKLDEDARIALVIANSPKHKQADLKLVKEMSDEGATDKEIAEKVMGSVSKVKRYRKYLDIKKRRNTL